MRTVRFRMVSDTLRANVGSIVTLEFRDGEIVDAKIVSVDSEEHRDVVYAVVRVRVPGRITRYEPGIFHRASLEEIKRVGAVES